MNNNCKELDNIEKEINNLDDILDWSSKIKKMKELKEQIITHRDKLNSFIEIINSSDIKKYKKKKRFIIR